MLSRFADCRAAITLLSAAALFSLRHYATPLYDYADVFAARFRLIDTPLPPFATLFSLRQMITPLIRRWRLLAAMPLKRRCYIF